MNLSNISIRVLTPETDLTAFKCAEGDLNDFLLDESKDYQTEYLAVTYLLKYVFTHGNRTGCRFVTVDALTTATGFYERNKFRFFTEKDKDDDTRLMYFDLKDFS